jgi:hypothetical protein
MEIYIKKKKMSFSSDKISFHYDSNEEVYILTFKNNLINILKKDIDIEDINRFYKSLLETLDNDKINDELFSIYDIDDETSGVNYFVGCFIENSKCYIESECYLINNGVFMNTELNNAEFILALQKFLNNRQEVYLSDEDDSDDEDNRQKINKRKMSPESPKTTQKNNIERKLSPPPPIKKVRNKSPIDFNKMNMK